MNRQERRGVWFDENAHPASPTTWVAMQCTGANMTLVDEWRDLEGDPESSGDWMTYGNFIEGAIAIAVESEQGEVQSPQDWTKHFRHMIELWEELGKITSDKYNDEGTSLAYLQARSNPT